MWWSRPTVLAHLAHRGAAEFAAPDDEGVVEQAALFEVEDQGGAGLVDVLADFVEVVVEVLAGAAVGVPVGVVELDEADAALDEAPGEQAVVGERGLAGLGAVEVEGACRTPARCPSVRGRCVCMR